MICVKYEAACLGNFLCHVLIGRNPIAEFDYGLKNNEEVLHTGSYHSADDLKFKKVYNEKKFKIISHNSAEFENFLYGEENLKFLYIELDSHFIEYRLNYIAKMPDWHKKSNELALEYWRNHSHPIASNEARRIVRLHKQLEQVIKKKPNDLIFKFRNFYLEKDTWINEFLSLSEKLNLDLSSDYLSVWYHKFRFGQKTILEKALQIRECIKNKKFRNDLTENEKGIIIGYEAMLQNQDDPSFFDQTYNEFSK
jgi:hypothetical protein